MYCVWSPMAVISCSATYASASRKIRSRWAGWRARLRCAQWAHSTAGLAFSTPSARSSARIRRIVTTAACCRVCRQSAGGRRPSAVDACGRGPASSAAWISTEMSWVEGGAHRGMPHSASVGCMSVSVSACSVGTGTEVSGRPGAAEDAALYGVGYSCCPSLYAPLVSVCEPPWRACQSESDPVSPCVGAPISLQAP